MRLRGKCNRGLWQCHLLTIILEMVRVSRGNFLFVRWRPAALEAKEMAGNFVRPGR